MHGLLSSLVKFGSFRVLRHTADSWLCVQTLPSYKNAYALVTESEKGTQFMLAVFSKSIVLRTKVPFNKSEVIAVQVQFDCQFGLIDATLQLRSPLRSSLQSFYLHFTTFSLITNGSGTLS